MKELRNIIDAIIEEGNTVIDLDENLECVGIEHTSTGDEYVFQGTDYNMLYDDYKNSAMYDKFHFDEYLYYISQSW